jgi:hypothetical protein
LEHLDGYEFRATTNASSLSTFGQHWERVFLTSSIESDSALLPSEMNRSFEIV